MTPEQVIAKVKAHYRDMWRTAFDPKASGNEDYDAGELQKDLQHQLNMIEEIATLNDLKEYFLCMGEHDNGILLDIITKE